MPLYTDKIYKGQQLNPNVAQIVSRLLWKQFLALVFIQM